MMNAKASTNSDILRKETLGKLPQYPSFRPSISVREVLHGSSSHDPDPMAIQNDLGPGEKNTDVLFHLAGRLDFKREASAKLYFYDLHQMGHTIQLMCPVGFATDKDTFRPFHQSLRRGDIVGVNGLLGKTKRGQLVVIPKDIVVLAPCLRPMPKQQRGTLTNMEKRHRNRHLDFLVNPEAKQVILTRAKVIQYLRNFLVGRDFLEVETPMLNATANGASATPFTTYSRALDSELTLRIAPELFLKQLVVGGFDRVFEIGKVFRNESLTPRHSPEFTMCEFYQAYATLDDLMLTTEKLLHGMVTSINGSPELALTDTADEECKVDFTPPFKRIKFVPGLQECGVDIMPLLQRHHESAQSGNEGGDDSELRESLMSLCDTHGVDCALPHSTPRLLDALCGHFLEPQCEGPTFITDHPTLLSPLAAHYPEAPYLSQRFELFVYGRELCNAYAELNDPGEQRQRFRQQQMDRDNVGDEEALPTDDAFCAALEYGMPPTGGWGLGIDRLCMLMANANNIAETQCFPSMRLKHNVVKDDVEIK